ncbi:HNH endonuclease [Pelagibacterium flavum]|uniref:HNH endonuclease n=1 Tax=Pelagibacterium flavum TaxID=2984530 RepID=A0ABY6IK91_9HYPH|nr:HNH endonuclease [Pelagibacterium sp. YIM 151497]UYQ71016.1 HNH endonuclease [Pelagibacterium sp. YIM 151497]
MSREVPEWIGKHDDQKVPDRVRLRIFDREGGMCHLSGRKIMPGDLWDLDHKVALINGGEHRESNLFPALRDKHRGKTALDVREKAVSARKRKKHLGIRKPSKLQSRGFEHAPKQRSATKPLTKRVNSFQEQ